MRNVAVIPGPPRPLGLGAGMTLWVRTIELQEPDVGRRTAWLAHPDFQTLHSKDDPSALRVADDNLRREAIEVIRVRWPSYLEESLIKLFVREWVEVFAPGLPIGLLWTTAAISFSLLALGYLGMALMRAQWSECWPLVLITFGVAATHAFGGTEARYTAPLRTLLIHVFLLLACITSAVVFRSPGGPASGTSGSGTITRRSRQFSVIRRPDPRLGSRRSHHV